MSKLYLDMHLPAPSRRELKRDAKLAKGFTVLLKRKLNGDVLPRSKVFQQLMALAIPQDNVHAHSAEILRTKASNTPRRKYSWLSSLDGNSKSTKTKVLKDEAISICF